METYLSCWIGGDGSPALRSDHLSFLINKDQCGDAWRRWGEERRNEGRDRRRMEGETRMEEGERRMEGRGTGEQRGEE